MKTSEPSRYSATPRELLTEEGVNDRFKSSQLRILMEEHQWLAPCVARHRLKRYDSNAVEDCIQRLSNGHFPGV